MDYREEKLLALKAPAISLSYGVDLMLKYPDRFNWQVISRNYMLTPEMAVKLKKYVDMETYMSLNAYHPISEELIRKNLGLFKWHDVSRYIKYFSEEFIKDFGDKLTWGEILINNDMTMEFIEENKDKINWHGSLHNTAKQSKFLTEEFARKYANRINWASFSKGFFTKDRKASDSFLIDMKDEIYWSYALQNCEIPEYIIEIVKGCQLFDWYAFTKYQKFSEEFFVENLPKLYLDGLFDNEKLDFLGVCMINKKLDLLLRLNNIELAAVFIRK